MSLTIYNLLGEEIAILAKDQIQPAGNHFVVWDGRNAVGQKVSSGIYFLSLKSGNFRGTKKMLLVQ